MWYIVCTIVANKNFAIWHKWYWIISRSHSGKSSCPYHNEYIGIRSKITLAVLQKSIQVPTTRDSTTGSLTNVIIVTQTW